MKIRLMYLVGFVLVQSSGAHAAAVMTGVGLEIEPIFGYERVQKLYPSTHQTSRLTYGARAIFVIPLVAAELEYTRGQDTEISGAQTVDETDDRIKLGARSRISLGSLLFLTVRGGGQAKRTTRSITQAGVTTTNALPFTYYPYAGAALGGRLGSLISVQGGLTVVFTAFPDMTANEYQATLGMTVRVK